MSDRLAPKWTILELYLSEFVSSMPQAELPIGRLAALIRN